MAKTEDIEAKLAAYVDGELDASDRAQIEQYLTANPQHRQLIKDLMLQRDMVRGLPHHAAPGEIAESFNAQLERAVLLGDVDAGIEAAPMRIGFWSQFRAAAAVLVLTAGLAALIYYLLPSAKHGSSPLADMRQPAVSPDLPVSTDADRQQPMAASPATEPSVASDDSRKENLSPVLASAPPAGAAAPPTTAETLVVAAANPASEQEARTRRALDAMNAPDRGAAGGGEGFGGGGGGRGGAGVAFREGPDFANVASNAATPTQQIFGNLLADETKRLNHDDSQVYVWSAGDSQAAQQEITRYLSDKHITWEAQSEPMPASLNLAQSQMVSAAKLSTPTVQMKSGAEQQGLQVTEKDAPPTAQVAGDHLPPQRILAKQVSRERLAQMRSDLDQLQSRVRNGVDQAASNPPLGVARPTIAMDAPASQPQLATPHLVPADVFSFAHFKAESVALSPPTTLPASPFPVATDLTLLPRDAVDVLIVVEPAESGIPATQPTTAP